MWCPFPLAVRAVARGMNGRLFGSATAAILLFICSTISSSAERELICHEISVEGSLRAGERFSSKIGNGLELRLLPMRFSDPSTTTPLDGWRIELVPVKPAGSMQEGEDRIFPVNLPLRFNPWQDIGSSYGMTAEQKLQGPIVYAFDPDDESFRRIRDLATDALWPYSARDPAHATEAYLELLNTLPLGTIRFTATHYRTAEGGKSIVEMDFLAQIIALENFAFAADNPRPVPCPPEQ
jgi:hypothetical protein